MELFKWTTDWSVGNELIDSDHVHLIELINKLHYSMMMGKGAQLVGEILNELIQYTVEHFGREERLMLEINYDEYAQHKHEYEKLIEAVQAIKAKFEAGLIVPPVSVFGFLTEWLFKHIKACDLKLGKVLEHSAH